MCRGINFFWMCHQAVDLAVEWGRSLCLTMLHKTWHRTIPQFLSPVIVFLQNFTHFHSVACYTFFVYPYFGKYLRGGWYTFDLHLISLNQCNAIRKMRFGIWDSIVCSLSVIFQSIPMAETLTAKITSVRLFSCVNSQMPFQMLRGRTHFLAQTVTKQCLEMCASMFLQSVLQFEDFLTSSTGKWSQSTV